MGGEVLGVFAALGLAFLLVSSRSVLCFVGRGAVPFASEMMGQTVYSSVLEAAAVTVVAGLQRPTEWVTHLVRRSVRDYGERTKLCGQVKAQLTTVRSGLARAELDGCPACISFSTPRTMFNSWANLLAF
jgi:hypothetical protein